jgi:cation:H+ antiporter
MTLGALGLHPAVVFLGGLVIVALGAEMLLRGATRLARMLGVPPTIIGLTVVALGTSMPELAVGLTAAQADKGAMSVGNITGANVLNILFILGMSALMRPLPTRSMSVRLEVPAMIATAAALWALSLDGALSRAEGLAMLAGAAIYTALLIRTSRRERHRVHAEFAREFGPPVDAGADDGRGLAPFVPAWLWNAMLLAVGIALAALGADLMVAGASAIAQAFGVSDAVIGLTIVALGTNTPEMVTTLIATLRNDRDVAIGNLIGSAVYNVLVILGLTVVSSPRPIEVTRDVLWIDMPLALLVAIVCLPVFKTDRRVSRLEGLAFVCTYVAYLASMVLWRVGNA